MNRFKSKNDCKFYTVTKSLVDFVVQCPTLPTSPSSTFTITINHNNKNVNLTIMNYTNGIIRLMFDLPDTSLKYKNRTNIGELLQLTPFQSISLLNHNELILTSTHNSNEYKIIIHLDSFELMYYINSTLLLSLNTSKTLSMLYESTLTSNSFDLHYHSLSKCFGLPERPSHLFLKDDTYRLFNTDNFQQNVDEQQPTYGSIPMLHGINSKHILTVFNNNSSDQWVDIKTVNNGKDKAISWITESGIIDLYVFSDSNYVYNLEKVSKLTGYAPMAPIFVFGYHQCRWGYKDIEDIQQVECKFNELNIPFDVFWMDIEHTHDKQYFTWNPSTFKDPVPFMNKLKEHNRYLVTIIDPHIKADDDYFLCKLLKEHDCLVKTNTNENYIAHCWPGKSYYADFVHYEKLLMIYKDLFKRESYFKNMNNIHTWIDMNEPAVFSSEENTMPKTNIHYDGIQQVTHKEVHNVYGYFYQKVTYEALKHRYNNTQRPFVLTRSYYAGSQQYGFIWTGDNQATYQFMNNSIETNIINGLCGHSSCGSDVGGFIGDPSKDLMKHWYELGSFYLFFRGHSAFNTIRREPWLFGDDICNSIKQSIIFRYNILLYVYTAFYNYTQNGVSILKPMWLVFRDYYDKLIDINDQSSMFVFGNELIGVNYLSLCETGCTVLNDIAKEYCLYDIHSGNVIKEFVISEGKGIDKVVIGGNVIPFSYQVKKSSFDVMRSPLSLKVFVDKEGKASGMVYYDDGVSLENNNAFIKLKVCYDNGRLNVVNENGNYDGSLEDMIPCWDKIEIYGVNKEGNKVINMLDKKMKIDKELNMEC